MTFEFWSSKLCPFTAWKHKERNRDRKNIYDDFKRFGDSSTVRNLMKQQIVFIRAYLDTI